MKIKTLIIAALLTCSTITNAIVITVQDDILDDTLIATPNSIYGEFDINSAIANDGSFINPFDITSAKATYTFFDDVDPNTYTNTDYESYTNVSSNNYYRNAITSLFNANETVQVITSLQETVDGTSHFNTGTTFTGRTHDDTKKDCGSWICTYNYYYTRNYDEVSGFTGQFVVEQDFDANSLNDLASDGVVGFKVAATSGDLIFGSASLTLDINTNPVEVAEPSTLALFGFALISSVFFRRKFIA
jgi:hypothetical protein